TRTGRAAPVTRPPTPRGAAPTTGRSGPASTPGRASATPRPGGRRTPVPQQEPAPPRSRPVSRSRSLESRPVGRSDRVRAGFAGSDAVDLFGRRDVDLAVADLAGPGRLEDHVHDLLDLVVVGQHLDLHLRHEVHLVLRAPVHLGVPALPA